MNPIYKQLKSVSQLNGFIIDALGHDTLLQLARDRICPHYIVANPLSKQEDIYFIQAELHTWFQEYIIRRPAIEKSEYNFLHFDPEKHSINEDVNIPEELRHINQLYHLPMAEINSPPGIYFLCLNGRIQYIGQAINIHRRIINHWCEKEKEFDAAFFILCNASQLNEMERSLISQYNPPLNKSFCSYSKIS